MAIGLPLIVPQNKKPYTNQLLAGLPKPLAQLYEALLPELERHLQDFFARCDDSLFESAESAQNNLDQTSYFDTMRQLRLKKAQVSEQFLSGFRDCFQAIIQPAEKQQSASLRDLVLDADQLELVQNEELEESVALRSIVGRARTRYAEPLVQLNTRFEYLLKSAIAEDQLPLDPGVLLGLFKTSTQLLDIDLSLRLFIYQRFEQSFIQQLGAVYGSANEILIVAGVLPKLRLQIKTAANEQDSSKRPDLKGATSHHAPAALAARELAEVQELLQQLKQQMIDAPGLLSTEKFAATGELSSVELTDLLSITTSSANSNYRLIDQVQNLLEHRFSRGEAATVSENNEHTINLVALFFDFILQDEALPVDVQALLARLQLPVLKVALRDAALFSAKDHPLRKLINELAHAGYGRHAGSAADQEFFALANQIVLQLGESVDEIIPRSSDLLGQLQRFLACEKAESDALEERVSRSARNSAITRHAREKIEILLEEKYRNTRPPQLVIDLLNDDWKDVMLHAYLNHGEDSQEWLTVDQIADDLLWSSQLHTDRKSLQRLKRILDELYQKIESALSANRKTPKLQEKLQALQSLHQVVLRKDHEAYANYLTEQTARNNKQRPDNSTLAEANPEFRYIRQIKNLRPGDWLRLILPESPAGKYCKVSAFIEQEQSFLLVNRVGARVAILDYRILAQSLQDGKLKIIEDTPLFDQAVANISNQLRSLTSQ